MFTKEMFLRDLRKTSSRDGELLTLTNAVNRFAIDEAFRYVNVNPDLSTTDALELFINDMDRYACKAKTAASSYIFSTAKAMGEDILDTWLFYIANN